MGVYPDSRLWSDTGEVSHVVLQTSKRPLDDRVLSRPPMYLAFKACLMVPNSPATVDGGHRYPLYLVRVMLESIFAFMLWGKSFRALQAGNRLVQGRSMPGRLYLAYIGERESGIGALYCSGG